MMYWFGWIPMSEMVLSTCCWWIMTNTAGPNVVSWLAEPTELNDEDTAEEIWVFWVAYYAWTMFDSNWQIVGSYPEHTNPFATPEQSSRQPSLSFASHFSFPTRSPSWQISVHLVRSHSHPSFIVQFEHPGDSRSHSSFEARIRSPQTEWQDEGSPEQ